MMSFMKPCSWCSDAAVISGICGNERKAACPAHAEELRNEAGQWHACMGCAWRDNALPTWSEQHPHYCVHLTPAHYVAQGYAEYWGDAAVNSWPHLTILRKQDGDKVEYLILNGSLRGPVRITVDFDTRQSWGAF